MWGREETPATRNFGRGRATGANQKSKASEALKGQGVAWSILENQASTRGKEWETPTCQKESKTAWVLLEQTHEVQI